MTDETASKPRPIDPADTAAPATPVSGFLALLDSMRLGLVLSVAAVAVGAASTLIGHEGTFGADGAPYFYGVFGALTAALVVGLARIVGPVLRDRSNDPDDNMSEGDASV